MIPAPARRLALPRAAAFVLGVVSGIVLSTSTLVNAADSTGAPAIDFARQIQPILAKRCYACHGPDEAEGGLRFIDQESAYAETESGDHAIVPGDVDASMLIARVESDDEYEQMPPEGDRLTPDEIELLKAWIAGGAAWSDHWAFEPMVDHDPPAVSNAGWMQNPIDAFIHDQLDHVGLTPNDFADRRMLIRRAYYDLTGLPPTMAQVQSFVTDLNPLAFERLVDDLLDSPRYGERWGRHWLDLVRYAETNSFERDGVKPNAWKYRDYVVNSFNDDKPADPLQSRADEMDDIITTTGQAFLGLTINCARCHDHKIDPIPQTDYYSMAAMMADVTTYGTRGDQTSNNQIDITPPDVAAWYQQLDRERNCVEAAMLEIEQAGIAKMSGPDQRASEPAKARSVSEKRS